MSWRTRKRGTRRQIGKKFPVKKKKLPPMVRMLKSEFKKAGLKPGMSLEEQKEKTYNYMGKRIRASILEVLSAGPASLEEIGDRGDFPPDQTILSFAVSDLEKSGKIVKIGKMYFKAK